MQGKTDPTTPTPDLTNALLIGADAPLAELLDLAAAYTRQGYETFFATIPTSGRLGLYRKAVGS